MKLEENTEYKEIQHTDINGYHYETVENDPNDVRIYRLKNGLTVYLAQNFDAPKIQTYIAVRTGSNADPADNTGLAHYLEHMMFKGTQKLGTQNWEQEKVLLDEISDLFEAHKNEADAEKKREIYRKIDEISNKASALAIANEYDKALSSLGATGTNAHTWLDETVYKNTIPANELEKWLKIEKDRFSDLVLRLFHTELESVYEEFNRAQDNDSRLVNYALMELLFPEHPNGQQTTLGKAEHLKNPSMKGIHDYFDTFYVPNNYALVLVGDLDFEKTIQLVDQYFGSFEYKELPKKNKIEEEPITKIQKRIVKSPTTPRVQIAWRTDSYGSRESIVADLIAHILSNKGEAGLLDLNINQAQKALYAQAYSVGFKEYGYFSMVIIPKEDQNLDSGIELLLNQIEEIKKGNFPDWILEAIVNDLKIQRLKSLETADGLATNLYDVFIKERSWKTEVEELELYASITKEEIVAFANSFFKADYVAVYKERGENENLIRVENPGITPIALNREIQSDFLKDLLKEESERIQPEFIDYQKEIKTSFVGERKLSFVANVYNDVNQLHLVIPLGTDHDRELLLALQYLQYLGTEHYDAKKLREAFYQYGIQYDFKCSQDQTIVSITALQANLAKGLDLVLHWMAHAKVDETVYHDFVQTIMESRAAAKKDKNRIMTGLVNYGKFGPNSRFRDSISAEELSVINPTDLLTKVSKILNVEYEIFYYGQSPDDIVEDLEKQLRPIMAQIPAKRTFPEPNTGNQVFFHNYDMVQVEMSRLAKGTDVDVHTLGKINVFNEYFGRGLSSIVFQEMRESKSLAYSAYVSYQPNTELHHPDYVQTYIGTQPDKLEVAIETLQNLLDDFPQVEGQFESAKIAALKKIETGRIKRTNIYFNMLQLRKLGITDDHRKQMYEEIQRITLPDLTEFFKLHIQNLEFNSVLLGKKENLDTQAVENLGIFAELSLEDIFGY